MPTNNLKTFLLRWGPALLVMALIFFASSRTSQQIPSYGIWDTLVKKGAHFGGYALLGLSLLRGLDRPGRKAVLITLALALLYASSDELHQAFVAGRHARLTDALIDLAGAGAAGGLWLASAKLRAAVNFGWKK